MILVDIALVIIVVAAITAGASVWGAQRARKNELAVQTAPQRQLARAVRLLDQVRQADDLIASLPSALSEDIHRFLDEHYKEDA